MRLLIVAVGRLKGGPERELATRYVDRARAGGRALGFSGPDMLECPESRAARPADRKAEEAAVLAAKANDAALIAMDQHGAVLSSEDFARDLARRRDAGRHSLAFIIGGADGLDPVLLARADATFCFGAMTLPHQLVRIMLAEQIYRATTILSGHPYHRP